MDNKSTDIHQSLSSPPPTSDVKTQLSGSPILIQEQEIYLLKKQFDQIYEKPKEYFILQLGDCAESFEDCTEDVIFKKCAFYTHTARLLESQLQKEVVLIGRIAGQYAKPRTDDCEEKNGITLPSYRGDMINSHEFDKTARQPNALRMLQAYDCAQKTIQLIDSFHTLHKSKKIFTSHEALMLDYETALTRSCTHHLHTPRSQHTVFNSSAHTVWLGDRTRKLSNEHVQYLSTIQNPIGIKIGPTQSPDMLVSLLKQLNPLRETGKLYLITRLGSKNVEALLPPLIDAVLTARFPVLWCVDPMHGNTFKLETGLKVRTVDDILAEYQTTAQIHKNMGSYLSGLHLEATFLPVTECVFSKKESIVSSHLTYYTSKCDPRLNPEQVQTIIKQL